jgi:hypothetical protein
MEDCSDRGEVPGWTMIRISSEALSCGRKRAAGNAISAIWTALPPQSRHQADRPSACLAEGPTDGNCGVLSDSG